MSAGISVASTTDPLGTLREYRALAPWGLRDLTALAGGILDAAGVMPLNAAARARPSERGIRFYVARKLVNPPDGRGTAAVYAYRHLLQVLAIKLRQMEGATLEMLIQEFSDLTGDIIERRVAAALGPSLPRPEQLSLLQEPGTGRGRVGRALLAWLTPVEAVAGLDQPRASGTPCRRIAVAPGIEILVDEDHPVLQLAAKDGDTTPIATAVRRALTELVTS
jgi:hypothetical protein